MPKLGFTDEECDKFDKLVAALSANNFDDMDNIVDQFSPTEAERFEKYLNALKPNEIQSNIHSELGLGSFIISMFKHYVKKPTIQPSASIDKPSSRTNCFKK